jgi:hypothetical protein
MPPKILALIDKTDNVELVRDQVAAILKLELAHQQTLAPPGVLMPRVFVERSRPWGEFLSAPASAAPIVNVWLDNANYDGSASNTVERQRADTIINVDCYGYGASVDDGNPAGGHTPGDLTAALESQRAVRLARNVLMSSHYTYLGMRGVVGKRWPQSLTFFQPQLDDRAAQCVHGARLALMVQCNEFSPQYEGEVLELISLEVKRTETGEILFEGEYPHGS